MATTLDLTIITPGTVKFDGKAEIVVAPGSAGDLAALPSHAPMLTTLRAGVLRATVAEDGGTRRVEYAVNGGFMQITPSKVIVLTDIALSAAEIDAEDARREQKRAEEALAQKRGSDDRAERDAVAWAVAKQEVAHKQQQP
jgi:F-type H+-transporting ATPase subunit epsilon